MGTVQRQAGVVKMAAASSPALAKLGPTFTDDTNTYCVPGTVLCTSEPSRQLSLPSGGHRLMGGDQITRK